jgi:predicted nucleic acid-binding protein
LISLPDSSDLIPYLRGRSYLERVDRDLAARRLVLCSVVAEEIMAGAHGQAERRRYDAFFARFDRLGHIVTPDDQDWRRRGRMLSRYRERFGAIEPRDHQNDVLIVLSALRLAQDQETAILTQKDRHLTTWLSLLPNRYGLRIERVRPG